LEIHPPTGGEKNSPTDGCVPVVFGVISIDRGFSSLTNRVADFLIPVNLLGDSMENPYLRANDTQLKYE
jgi:hypothetical protein